MATKTLKGKTGLTTENIFPVIKQFLYSDHELFLREFVANAVDATQKMKALASSGDFKGKLGELKVSIGLDEKKSILRIIDRGIDMTVEEVDCNRQLPNYSKIAQVETVLVPFEKTPKMSIKRFLYK